jgi:hypothetical protein
LFEFPFLFYYKFSSNLFIANIRHSRIDAISLNGEYHTVIYSNHENETGITRPIALDLDTTNGYYFELFVDNLSFNI